MILLSVRDVIKHFGPEPVLAGVSFDLRAGEKASLVGPNGAGKTTLMKIITGEMEPDSGEAQVARSIKVGRLEQHPQFAPGRTVWEEARSALSDLVELGRAAERAAAEIAAATAAEQRRKLAERFDDLQHELARRDGYHLDHKIERVLSGLGFDRQGYHQPVAQLSGGQQNRLLLARLLLEDPDLMLLDEPSNHLDIEATEWLEDFLVGCRCAVLVVSHDRYFLDRVTNQTLELFRGTVDSYPGNFTKYRRLKGDRLQVQRRTYDKQQIEIAKMEDFVRRHHYGQKHAQAEDRRKKLERIERVELPREIAAPPMGFPAAARSGDIALRVEHLTKGFDRPLFADATFDILRGEKWGLLGPNGSGKTTLLRCLLGELSPDGGRAIWGANVKVGYFDQLLGQLPENVEVVDAIRPRHKEFVESQRRDLLARFGVTGEMVFQKVTSLSGGERNRAALAMLAASDSNFLVLDEPTNHLDLWARASLEKSLKEFDGTVLFVSHDRYFLNEVADHLLVVEPPRIRVIDGNYDTYRHLAKLRAAEAAGPPAAGDRAAAPAAAVAAEDQPRRRRKFPYRKVADLERDIAQREARVDEIHREMADPDFARDGERVKAVKAELAELEKAIAMLYAHWEEASELN